MGSRSGSQTDISTSKTTIKRTSTSSAANSSKPEDNKKSEESNVKSRPKSGVKINNLKLKMPTAADVPKIPKGPGIMANQHKKLTT